MRDFIKAENFYLKKDSVFKGICLMLLGASVILLLWLRSGTGGWSMNNLLEPLSMVVSTTFFLYFILPIHACFFSTEGFESGTIKNIISSGKSRTTYFVGKFLTEIKVVLWSLLQFYMVFVILYYLAAIFSGAEIKNIGLERQAALTIPAVFYNVLYLTSYVAVVLMIGFLGRKTSTATIFTFAFIFGNVLISGYWKDSAVPLLRTISEYSLMTQIFKFSGLYVVNSKRILLTGPRDHAIAILIPITIIAACVVITLFIFNKRDIQTL